MEVFRPTSQYLWHRFADAGGLESTARITGVVHGCTIALTGHSYAVTVGSHGTNFVSPFFRTVDGTVRNAFPTVKQGAAYPMLGLFVWPNVGIAPDPVPAEFVIAEVFITA